MSHNKIRIAKLLANYNQGSRRQIEKLINDKKIYLNGKLVVSPVTFASINDKITINKKSIKFLKNVQVFKFFKPKNVICSKNKQDDRKIIYEIISPKYKNFIFAGRLDYKSEGLIVLTNSSSICRNLELPINKFERVYEVRVYGELKLNLINKLSLGSTINKIRYKPFRYKITSKIKKNTNLLISLHEGKKNEIREIFKSINLQVNKLKRIAYGPFKLNNMQLGSIEKVSKIELKKYENYIRDKKR